MSALHFFLQGIPEGIGVVALSMAIARVPLRWGYICIGGLIIAIASYIIRELPVTFGLHLPVVIFLVFILLVKSTTTKPSKVIIAVFASIFTLAFLEYIISSTYFAYMNTDYEQAISNESLWAVIGIFQALLLIIIAFVISKFFKANKEAWK